ncbi:class I SAM-dependent methyltransferase [Dermatobacter hominis]|uniref:class I SAM-dependent methyltransferase n=1 Tax=Dermatobacter hominis TaxID=2884263 RepID=UPI001D0FEF9C|nr:class I SAM-dependent methyltransferase [Dermatobacter hominis]UDY33966.1 class I SAM-dependent methyltransferase [Dermatobacter hominis]
MDPIRKVLVDDHGGGETSYWEDEWSGLDLEATRAALLAGDPVLRLLERHLDADGLVLEAGCGSGAVAVALDGPGRTVVGIDLAAAAVRRAARAWPEFLGVVGDVTAMPFADRTFGAVVSLGVLEHTETGPGPALVEHRRVLRPGGLLLVTVPRISPLKAARDAWHLGIRRRDGYVSRGRWVVRRPTTSVERSSADGTGRAFHQYEFAARDWAARVRDAGFEVLSTEPHLVGAGLGDVPFLARRGGSSAGSSDHAGAMPTAATSTRPSGLARRLKRAATSEQGDDPLERAVAEVARRLVGHMVLAVARRPDR